MPADYEPDQPRQVPLFGVESSTVAGPQPPEEFARSGTGVFKMLDDLGGHDEVEGGSGQRNHVVEVRVHPGDPLRQILGTREEVRARYRSQPFGCEQPAC